MLGILSYAFFFFFIIFHGYFNFAENRFGSTLFNYRLSQKFKLFGNGEFNHLTISLTLFITCGPKLPLNKVGPNKWEFNILNGR